MADEEIAILTRLYKLWRQRWDTPNENEYKNRQKFTLENKYCSSLESAAREHLAPVYIYRMYLHFDLYIARILSAGIFIVRETICVTLSLVFILTESSSHVAVSRISCV